MTTARAAAPAAPRHSQVLDTFADIKSVVEPFSIDLPFGKGTLVPVTRLHEGDADLLATCARWRAENAFAFPTQFTVTLEGTARWLRLGLLDVPDRLLFLVRAPDGTLIGHLGFANCAEVPGVMEIDNVVRGVKTGAPGIMSASMQALTDWAQNAFAPRQIFLRVFSHNAHAIAFYERCGYLLDRQLPLQRTEESGRVTFTALPDGDARDPDAFFSRMILRPVAAPDPDRA